MDMTDAKWRKSSRSGSNGGSCIEVADNLPGIVLIRDTKDREGATLDFTPGNWQSFVNLAKQLGPVS